jgi:hypothetical protein
LNKLCWLVLASLVLGGCTSTGRTSRSSDGAKGPPPVGTDRTSLGSCVEQYSPQTLRNRQYALDGVVQRLDLANGDALVTLEVIRWFKGGSASTVTLRSAIPAGTAVTSADQSGLSLKERQRYLVSGDGDFIWSCGFTTAFSESLAAEWDAALE